MLASFSPFKILEKRLIFYISNHVILSLNGLIREPKQVWGNLLETGR